MYILLDIDGVLNTQKDWKIPYTLNPDNVQTFGECLKGKNAKIVLTSSWRKGFISRNNPDNTKQIKELEKALGQYNLPVIGVLNYKDNRGQAVAEFLTKYPDSICIDDDISEFKGYEKLPRLLKVDSRHGFNKKCVKELAKLLN